MDRRLYNFDYKFASGMDDGAFDGYASISNHEDAGGDLILQGAFKTILESMGRNGSLPKMLLSHGGLPFVKPTPEMLIPVGKWDNLLEDSKGLQVNGHLINLTTDIGKRIHGAMKEKVLDGLSIGFKVDPTKVRLGKSATEPRRTIGGFKALPEISIVLFGMNERALIENVKSSDIDEINTLSDAEAFLREAEAALWSKKTATDFVGRVAKIARREAGDDQGVKSLLEQIRSTRRMIVPTS
jgi:uncharacterized protein